MTTDNLPAVPTTDPPRDIAKTDTDSWIAVISEVSRFAQMIAGTEFVPKSLRDNPAAVAAAMIYGREVGLPPMAALTQTHVIEGRPSLSAEASRAKVIGAGHDIDVIETTGAICRMRARRRGTQVWTPEVVWTIDMARAAGLLNKSNWKNNPRRMLQARASGELCHLYFPDVLLGFAVTEELEDDGGVEVASTTTAEQQTTPVARKRAVAKKAAPAALSAATRPAPSAGLPLPGDDGYEEPTPRTTEQPAETTEAPPLPTETPDAPAPDRELAPDTDAGPAAGRGEAPEAGPAEVKPGPARPMTRPQTRMLFARLKELGVDPDDRDERLAVLAALVGRAELASSSDLTSDNAKTILDTLARVADRVQLYTLLDEIDQARSEGADGIVP